MTLRTHPAHRILDCKGHRAFGLGASASEVSDCHVPFSLCVFGRTSRLREHLSCTGQLGHPKPAPAPGQSKFFRSQFRVPRPRFVKVRSLVTTFDRRVRLISNGLFDDAKQALENKVAKQVVCGGQHTLILLQDGRVLGMGDNVYGQVGVERKGSSEEDFVELPVEIASLSAVKQLACGEDFSVALTTAGDVLTWGRGQIGQLGLGGDKVEPLLTPTKVPGLPAIRKVFVGPNQVFAVEFTDGTRLLALEYCGYLSSLTNTNSLCHVLQKHSLLRSRATLRCRAVPRSAGLRAAAALPRASAPRSDTLVVASPC